MTLPVATEFLFSTGGILLLSLVLDRLLGDPAYPLHPVRVIGWLAQRLEQFLFKIGFTGYLGGGLLVLILCAGAYFAMPHMWKGLYGLHPWLPWVVELYLVYSLIAFGDLLKHGQAVLQADGLAETRREASKLVSRDLESADRGACYRATAESMAENLVDGFFSPILFYWIFGFEGLLIFKIISSLDSMIGYKNERYCRFGFVAAKLDDLLNWLPARLFLLPFYLACLITPSAKAGAGLKISLGQHNRHQSPNSGWPMAAFTGALNLRYGGPVVRGGEVKEEPWFGPQEAPILDSAPQLQRLFSLLNAFWLVCVLGVIGLVLYPLVTQFYGI